MNQSISRSTIEKQFDYICKRVLKNERIDYIRYLKKISKKELSFSEMEEHVINQFSYEDTYSIDLTFFNLYGIDIGVKDELLSDALNSLSNQKRKIMLLYYFMDFNDLEIARILNISRSTVNEHRRSGLVSIKKFMEEDTR
ncbi:TPA: RNA polymerase sigma factor [Streptococcus suis]